ncbi:diacylglycerol kinase family protein [Streptomyces sp. NPDC050560]|uniref:diacylglycerol kinase family protein n=1 Tax=Streptomyces sp. NPDC050560 TaxID=3365630 RepID=UPI0037A1CF49
MSASDELLVVIDPVARRTDGESVRIARDVLGARAATKVCLPDDPEEFARALTRRGSRRPVVVGDDRALLRAVSLLYRERGLGSCPLAMVPVGPSVSLARSLGVPQGAVAAARTVLEGAERRLHLLVDDSDGLVLGDLRIPPVANGAQAPAGVGGSWLRQHCQSLVRSLAPRQTRAQEAAPPVRLRVEADGVTLVDLDRPVEDVTLRPTDDGLARVAVRPADGSEPVAVRAHARTVTVSGADFRYHADIEVTGPVRTRTWTARAGAWGLVLPAGAEPGGDGSDGAHIR